MAETKNKNYLVDQSIGDQCKKLFSIRSTKSDFLKALNQAENLVIGCRSTVPVCSDINLFEERFSINAKMLALTKAREILAGRKRVNIAVNFSDSEIGVFGGGRPPSGMHLKPDSTIILNYVGVEEFGNLSVDVSGSILDGKFAPGVSLSNNSISGTVSSICELSKNSEKRLASILIPHISTRIAGLELSNITFRFNYFLGPEKFDDKYAKFDWPSLIEPLISNAFGFSVPNSGQIISLSFCSNSEARGLVKFTRRARQVVRGLGLTGASQKIISKAKIDFIRHTNYPGYPFGRDLLKLSLPSNGLVPVLYLSMDRENGFMIAGYGFDPAMSTEHFFCRG
jgi:hypothetical protein